MEQITRGTTNTLYIQCHGQLITTPFYLFKFLNTVTKDIRYCICSDTSAYPLRYQQFAIVENNNPTVSTNQIKLDTTGTWEFYIYEQSSSTNIDPTGLNQVKEGLAEINSTTTTLQEYTGQQSTFKQYNP